jgi:hypothetical protein
VAIVLMRRIEDGLNILLRYIGMSGSELAEAQLFDDAVSYLYVSINFSSGIK